MSAGAGFMLSRTIAIYQNSKNKSAYQPNNRLPSSYQAPRILAETEDEFNTIETVATDEMEESEDDLIDGYEQSLYKNYINYYSQQVSPQDWERVTSGRDVYTIRENDTLWDISKVMFDDPNYWPKLWSVNPSLGNPHLIRPGGSLGFIHGTAGQVPSMVILDPEAQKQAELKHKKEPLPDFLKNAKIKIPAPKKSVPVLNILPESLPVLYFKSQGSPDDLSSLEVKYERLTSSHISSLPYYMSSSRISSQGKISDKKHEGIWSSTNDKIILEMEEPVNPGQKLIIVKNLGKLVQRGPGIRGPFGYQIEVQGEVQIIGRITDSFDLYEASVTETLSPIITNSSVIIQPIPKFDLRVTNINGSSEAQIIGFPPFAKNRKKGMLLSLLYLNRGENDGFSIGQMYQVQANPRVRKKFPYGYNIKMGELKIVHVEDRFATGLITAMSNPIQLGDHVVPINTILSKDSSTDPFIDENEDSDEIIFEEDNSESFENSDDKDSEEEEYIDEEDSIEEDSEEVPSEEEFLDDEYIDEEDSIEEDSEEAPSEEEFLDDEYIDEVPPSEEFE